MFLTVKEQGEDVGGLDVCACVCVCVFEGLRTRTGYILNLQQVIAEATSTMQKMYGPIFLMCGCNCAMRSIL